MTIVLAAEWLKLRRSRTARTTVLVMTLAAPLITVALVHAVGTDAAQGMVAAKIDMLAADSTLTGRLALAAQVLSVLSLLGAGFLATWVVGREFADDTVAALWATPVPRGHVALAKVLLSTVVSVVATVLAGVIAVLCVVSLAGDPWDARVLSGGARVVGAGVLTALLSPTFALVATLARGYLAPLASLVGVVAVTQLAAAFGAGAWFPFAVPALWAGAGGPQAAAAVGVVHLATVPTLGALATWATVREWSTMRLG